MHVDNKFSALPSPQRKNRMPHVYTDGSKNRQIRHFVTFQSPNAAADLSFLEVYRRKSKMDLWLMALPFCQSVLSVFDRAVTNCGI
jgi:hypothetical protein